VVVAALVVVDLFLLDEARLEQALDGAIGSRALAVDGVGDPSTVSGSSEPTSAWKHSLSKLRLSPWKHSEEPLALHVLLELFRHRIWHLYRTW